MGDLHPLDALPIGTKENTLECKIEQRLMMLYAFGNVNNVLRNRKMPLETEKKSSELQCNIDTHIYCSEC